MIGVAHFTSHFFLITQISSFPSASLVCPSVCLVIIFLAHVFLGLLFFAGCVNQHLRHRFHSFLLAFRVSLRCFSPTMRCTHSPNSPPSYCHSPHSSDGKVPRFFFLICLFFFVKCSIDSFTLHSTPLLKSFGPSFPSACCTSPGKHFLVMLQTLIDGSSFSHHFAGHTFRHECSLSFSQQDLAHWLVLVQSSPSFILNRKSPLIVTVSHRFALFIVSCDHDQSIHRMKPR